MIKTKIGISLPEVVLYLTASESDEWQVNQGE